MKKAYKNLAIIAAIALCAAAVALLLYRQYKWNIVAWYLGIPAPAYSIVAERDVMVPMRDGVKLATDVYRPDAPGKFPVIVIRTPYGKNNPAHRYEFTANIFAGQGYAVAVQDVRGKYGSEGVYYPYVNEAKDGHDTFNWAGTQGWSAGKVGTFGISYFGRTQWLPAPLASPYLKCMIPIFCGQYDYKRVADGGVFRYDALLIWHYQNALRTAEGGKAVDWDRALRHLPLIEADDALGIDINPYNDKISNPVPGPYWDRTRVDDKVSKMKAPAMVVGGWFDFYLDNSIDDFNRMITISGSPQARRSRLVLGPWIHLTRSKFDDADFGKEAGFLGQIKLFLRWYDYWLKGADNGIMDEDPVRIFVMGKNEWRGEKAWPLPGTVYTKYYLSSDRGANGLAGDGSLVTAMPPPAKPDRYVYDPEDPAPSIGGASVYGNARPGPVDQKERESRKDVLVYCTPPLEEDTEVTGPVRLILYASSSARDTDFTATLADVRQDGKSISLNTGVVRARYRDSLARPSFLEKGKIYRFEINIGPTANVFLKGHRIRLQVASSYFPEYDRNLNTGAPIGMTKETVKAEQAVYHGGVNASFLLLPVIPVKR